MKQNPDKIEQIRKKNLKRIKSKYKYKKYQIWQKRKKICKEKKWKEEKQEQNDKRESKKEASSISSLSRTAVLADAVTKIETSATEKTPPDEKSTGTPSTILRLSKATASRRNSRNKLKLEYDKARCRITRIISHHKNV